jgi:DNA-binding NarL/FixJ family response regulator
LGITPPAFWTAFDSLFYQILEELSSMRATPIESHRQNLMQKLGLHNTAEIVLYSVRKSIISA